MRHPLRLLLAAILALGICHLALLPPFEGFDETGHYSSLLQVADTGTLPRLGTARMAQEVEAYQRQGPMPYMLAAPGTHPTYRDFFAGPTTPRGMAASPRFAPGMLPNWQSQHPPLYYALLAPITWMTSGLALRDRLFWLRTASFLLAFAALCLAVRSNEQALPGSGLATALWPLLMPGWFPEMARLGNDSLACLLLVVAWSALLAIRRHDGDWRAWLLLGAALGLGILTKAYVIPIAIFCLIFLTFDRLWQRRPLAPLLACAGLVIGCGGIWPLWLVLQGLPATNDSALLAERGGLLAGLARHWSAGGMAHSLGSIVKSFVWSGSWSFGRPALLFYLPPLLLMALIGLGWLRGLFAAAAMPRENLWLPGLFILPLVAGLVAHSLLWLAMGQSGVTGGWYLHVLLAPMALLSAAALRATPMPAQPLAIACLAYALAFGAGLAWLQIGLFAGCVHLAPPSPVYEVDWGCALDAPLLFRRLAMLAHPGIGMAAGSAALLLLLAAVVVALRRQYGRNKAPA